MIIKSSKNFIYHFYRLKNKIFIRFHQNEMKIKILRKWFLP